jgi:post-segregation antitoxin (ccd killing protein)
MGAQVTVCAKVPAELKEKLSNLGVNVSELIREFLQSEVDRLERERLKELPRKYQLSSKRFQLKNSLNPSGLLGTADDKAPFTV